MNTAAPLQTTAAKPALSSRSLGGKLLQRKCACGSSKSPLGEMCDECQSHALQRKLAIGASNDPLEQEADRIADQVMAAPPHPAVSTAPPRIQRLAAQPAGQMDTAPASVDRVLSSPGRPLEPELRQDMEQRFGHNFSRVRVHTGSVAEQSAQEVNAYAYTVGQNIVLGGGQRDPQTSGRRLLAHELTHVMQQESGIRPQLQRQSKPDVNKSAKFIEETYRSGARRLNDPALSKAAYDVRLCRELGSKYCEILVTDEDINSMYAEWSLIESVYDSDVADQAIRDHKLREAAKNAAEQAKRQEASGNGTGLAVMGGLTGLAGLITTAPSTPSPSIGGGVTTAIKKSAQEIAKERWAEQLKRKLAEEARRKLAARIATGVGITTVVVFGVVVSVQLWNLKVFQEKLYAAGYKYLPSPRGVCMRECHQGSQNLPRPFDFPERTSPWPRSGPFSPGELRDIDEWLNPIPQPDPAEKERRRRREDCTIKEARPRGGNREHDALAERVTGEPVEYLVITPERASKQFDGMDLSGTLYDVKTRHDWLVVLGLPAAPLTVEGASKIAFGVGKLRAETIYERDVAQRCGHAFHLATNNLQVVQEMREILGDILSHDEIEYVRFDWRQ
jgi:hypothetical protein